MERERTRKKRVNLDAIRARRLSHGLKKTVRPVVMSEEEFDRLVREERELTSTFIAQSRKSMLEIIAQNI